MNYDREFSSIQSACRSVFGCDVDARPRAMQALTEAYSSVSLLGTQIAVSSDLECFRRVLASSPACTDAVLRQDVSLQSLIAPKVLPTSIGELQRLGPYQKLLSDIFHSKWPFPSGLNDAGLKVKLTKTLTETDLFTGCLQAGRMSVLPNQTAKGLLRAAGLYENEYVDPRGDDYLAALEVNCAPVLSIDQSHAEQQLVIYLDSKNRLRLHPFGANAVGTLEDRLVQKGTFVFRGGVIQPVAHSRLFALDAIVELEDLMNSSTALEANFQKFFESHPEFLKALDYERIHAQPILYKDDGSRLIPDFFLEQLDCGWHAIADLKRPYDNMVIRKKNRVYFAQWVQEAISQLHYYKEWFDDAKNRAQFETSQGLSTRVFRPKMVLIAGRSSHFVDEVERIRLLSEQDQALTLWTYDDVLRRAKRYRTFADDRSAP